MVDLESVDAKPGTDEASGRTRVSRRRLANLLLGSGLASTLAAIFVPIIRFVLPPESQELAQHNVVAAKLGELPPDSGKIFKFGTIPGILVHTAAGEYVAFSANCTHLDCTVQYRPDFKHLWCACHNGHFDLTGTNIQGPPPRPLESFKVDILGDEILVSRRV